MKIEKIFAGIVGIAAAGTDTWMNVEYVLEAEKAVTSLVMAVPLSSLIAAACLPFMALAWQNRKLFEWTGFLLLFVLTASFSFTASLDRSGASRDKVGQVRQVENMRYRLAQDALKSAQQKKLFVEAQVKAECSGVYSALAPKRKSSKAGPGRICKGWKKALPFASQEISTAKATLLKAGTKVSRDSMAIRIASLLPVTEKQVQQYQPMLLPLALQLGGLLFIGFAFAPTAKPRPMRPVRVKKAAMSKKEIALAYYQAQIAKGRRTVPLAEIAKLKGVMVHKSTISRWLKTPELSLG